MLTFTESETETQQDLTPERPSDLTPVQFFLGIRDRIDKENESAEQIRLHMMFLLCRRFRAITPSDRFGIVKYGQWLEHKAFDTLHSTNLFQALTRGAEANFTQAKVRLDLTSSNSAFENRSAKKISEGILENLQVTQWNAVLESQMFYAATLKLNYVLLSRFNRGIDLYKIRIPQYGSKSFELSGLAICNECDAVVPYSNLMETQCPSCGSDALTAIKEPEMQETPTVTGYEEYPAGSSETLCLDGFDFRVDESGAEPGDLTKAQWFEYHYLVNKSELKKLYPHLQLKSVPKWTDATQWKLALKRYENAGVTPQTELDKQNYEVREIWIDKCQAEEYVSPVDWKLEQFSIKAGQRLSEVTPHGAVFAFVGDELVFVYDEDKNNHLTGGTWLADPTSYYGLGLTAALPINKKINHLDNINMDGIARAMRGSIIYDPEAINGASLEGSNTNIPLRPEYAMTGKSFDEVYSVINVSGLSQDAMMYLASQKETMQMIMGVPNAAIGEGDKYNQTLGGQQVLTQRADGLLIPAKKSQAAAMEQWFFHQLLIIQTYYDNDRIKDEFGSAYGEEWLDDEIEAFCKADLRKALIIRYTPGSEVPQTRAEKEQKFFALVDAGLLPLTPDVMSKGLDLAGLAEFDIMNYESNKRLGQKRWNVITESYEKAPEAEMIYQQAELQMLDIKTGQRLVDAMGNKIPNPVLQQIMAAPELQINPKAEDHNMQIEFWSDKLRGMLAQVQFSQLKIDICSQMILMHEMAVFAEQTKAQTLMALSAMPAGVGSKMIDQETNEPEPAKPKSKAKTKAK